ncbi:MAG: hypothetical protein LBL21_02420 [Rickettsiales bacterium]|jgi:hypothetical protein|nr:hypothetical protein [Rickettsiales bacterium]
MKPDFTTLCRTLSLKTLPVLRGIQFARFRENVEAGLSIGLSREESWQLAIEDFRTSEEKAAELMLTDGLRWLATQDIREIRETMYINGWLGR